MGDILTIDANGLIALPIGQLKFPEAQNASADPNTLDDYKEGAWTPIPTSATGTITSYTSSGSYIKVGKLVTVTGLITLVNNGTGGGVGFVSGGYLLYGNADATTVLTFTGTQL